mgnify:CR=1 FL=1
MEEKLRILKMVAEGKVTAEEGLELLNGITDMEEKIKPSKWLKVKVWEGKDVDTSSKPKVNVSLPIGLAKMVLQMIPEKAKANMNIDIGEGNKLSVEDLHLEKLINGIREYGPMTLVEVDDEDAKVLVTLE